jgi:hypothetical protein
MKKYYEYQKVTAVLLSFILIISSSGCFTLHGISREDIQYANKNVYFLHGPTSFFKLRNAIISDGLLTGTIDYVISTPAKDETVHIYAAPESSIRQTGDKVQVPFANIVNVEVYKIDGLKTVITVAGSLCIAFIGVLLIELLTKGASCPFIYTNDDGNYNFSGEIYSGATALPLERDDYLPVRNLKPSDNYYRLRITNEVEEIQNTNLTELIVVDHQPGTKILMDKTGNAYSLSDLKKPVAAFDSYGTSVLKELSSQDSLRYLSTIRNDRNIKDTISLTFDRPSAATVSKLVIKAKNTMWLDYMFGKFTDLFGTRFEKWKEKRDKKPREELLKWSFDQGIPMAVYLQTDTGLKYIDYFNLPGPMADKEDILKIDLSEIHTDKINLKLVSGVLFWDIDYVGMDYSPSVPVNKTIVPLYSAIDEKGKDVSSLLLYDDEKYLIQPLPVNKTDLSFTCPNALPGMERSVFLHSKGHYEILRDTKGKPDIAYLKTFMEPGSFIKFSKDHFLEYYYKNN